MTDATANRIMRKELYERVWAESVAHVAPKLGLWPRRLSELCQKNRIPVPGRDYWYNARSARKTLREPLPDADQDWEITFTPSQPGPPKPIENESADSIQVPDNLKRSHRLVQEYRAATEDAWHDHGLLRPRHGCLDIRVAKATVRRACRIMDTLIKACERRGWPVSVSRPDGHKTVIDVEGCPVEVHLLEGWRQEPRELSQSEKEWEVQTAWPRKRPPYDLVPNGRLKLTLDSTEARMYAQWKDGMRRRVDDMLNDVMARLEEVPEKKRKVDQARAAEEVRRREQERLQREEEERQRERARLRRAEEARVDALFADAEAWERSRQVRAYIDAWILNKEAELGATIAPGSEEEKWVAWARAQADGHDPLVGTPARDAEDDPDPEPPSERRKSFAEIMNSLCE